MFGIPIPSLFVCFLIFCAWIYYERLKSDKKQQAASQDFWAREDEANHTRNKDISDLPLLCPDADRIPMPESEDESVTYYQERVRTSLALPMMNLSGYSNTDLKLAYGTGNFNTLSEYDQNFNDFLMNMSNLGKSYFQSDALAEAAAVYRLCIEFGSDKSTDYEALARAYAAMGSPGKISELIIEVEHSHLPRKEALIRRLHSVQDDR